MSEQITKSYLQGSRIVITGASRGFGAMLARGFHRAGADLLLAPGSRPNSHPSRRNWPCRGPAGQWVEAVEADLSSADASGRLFSGVWGAPDVLINNAGVQGPSGGYGSSSVGG